MFYNAYLRSCLNSVLGSGWNTSLGPEPLELTKLFPLPARNTLISWKTIVCHVFFVLYAFGMHAETLRGMKNPLNFTQAYDESILKIHWVIRIT